MCKRCVLGNLMKFARASSRLSPGIDISSGQVGKFCIDLISGKNNSAR